MRLWLHNESTLIPDSEAWQIAWAVDYQLRFHLAPAWPFVATVGCRLLPKGRPIPPRSSVLHLVDAIGQGGALGFHDEDGTEIPFAQIGVHEVSQARQQVSEVCSHEGCELAVDPHVNATWLDTKRNWLIGAEVGDPCQGNGYDVGAPEGRSTGIVVADFVLPGWGDPNTPPDAVTDFRGALKGPFTVGPQGYVGYLDLANVAGGWQQHFGAEANKAAAGADDRAAQRRRSGVLTPSPA